MAHTDHEPGTREECDECIALAYEPGWYKVLRDERVLAADHSVVAVPEADEPDVDVVIAERPHEPARRRR